MQVEVLLFAAAREHAGCDSVRVDVLDGALAADVLQAVGVQLPGLRPLLDVSRLAVDCQYVDRETPIKTGAEIALIPPVSGG